MCITATNPRVCFKKIVCGAAGRSAGWHAWPKTASWTPSLAMDPQPGPFLPTPGRGQLLSAKKRLLAGKTLLAGIPSLASSYDVMKNHGGQCGVPGPGKKVPAGPRLSDGLSLALRHALPAAHARRNKMGAICEGTRMGSTGATRQCPSWRSTFGQGARYPFSKKKS